MGDCEICGLLSRLDELPETERIWVDEDWRLSHGWSSLEGWLVLSSRHHVQGLDELSPTAAATLGALLPAITAGLRRLVGAERTFVMLFAERPGFHHLHLHIVPRMPWFTEADMGPAVFHFLNLPDDELVPLSRREELSRQIASDLEVELRAR